MTPKELRERRRMLEKNRADREMAAVRGIFCFPEIEMQREWLARQIQMTKEWAPKEPTIWQRIFNWMSR